MKEKLDLTKLTTNDFTKQPDPNCEEWKTYKSTKSKKVKLAKVIHNKFWLWRNLNSEYFKQFTKFLKAHSNKCVNCDEELDKHMTDEQDTRMCENCSSKHDYCRVCDEESYNDNGVDCTHKVWNDTHGDYSGTGDSETEDKYYRRSLWELCEVMGGNFASDLLIATTAINHKNKDLYNFGDYADREIVVGSNIYKIPDTDAVQHGFDWIWTLPTTYQNREAQYKARCQETLQKTIKWIIEYISLADNTCYRQNGYSYDNKYGDFNLTGEVDYYGYELDKFLRDILKSSRRKIVYTITRISMFKWHLQVNKPNGDPLLGKIERNKIRCQAQLIHFLNGKKDKK